MAPLINSNLRDNGQDRLFDSMIQQASFQVGREELVFPERAGQLMWFVVHGIVTNEGRLTARIRIFGEGEFIAGESPLLPGETIAIPHRPVPG